MESAMPDYWPAFQAYHHVREPLYRRIIAELRLPAGGRILDAGCGDAFYSHLLAEALGPAARVVAVDNNPALLRASQNTVASVHRLLTDLEYAGLRPRSFDAIWVCRSMHSAQDPLVRLSALARLLRSGGRLVVIENDFPHYPILSLPTDFETRLLEARCRYLREHAGDGCSLERFRAASHLPAWLDAVGLKAAFLRTYVSEEVVPMSAEVEHYWRLTMNWEGKLIHPYLSGEDWQAYKHAFDPASPEYVLRRPGFHCLELTTVACGIAQ